MSTIPAVDERMFVAPYLIDWLIPQKELAGEVSVIGVKLIEPVNLVVSAPPDIILSMRPKSRREVRYPRQFPPPEQMVEWLVRRIYQFRSKGWRRSQISYRSPLG